MALGSLPGAQHLVHLGPDDGVGGEHHGGVQVALHRLARPDPGDRVVEGHPPVDADDVGPGLAHVVQQLAGADAEVDPRDVGDTRQHPGAVRGDAGAVLRRGQRADPGVEQLHGTGPGVDLHPQERQGDVGQPVQQGVPQLGVAVHQRLGLRVVLARPAFHQVAGQGERRAGEADQRGRAELTHQ